MPAVCSTFSNRRRNRGFKRRFPSSSECRSRQPTNPSKPLKSTRKSASQSVSPSGCQLLPRTRWSSAWMRTSRSLIWGWAWRSMSWGAGEGLGLMRCFRRCLRLRRRTLRRIRVRASCLGICRILIRIFRWLRRRRTYHSRVQISRCRIMGKIKLKFLRNLILWTALPVSSRTTLKKTIGMWPSKKIQD